MTDKKILDGLGKKRKMDEEYVGVMKLQKIIKFQLEGGEICESKPLKENNLKSDSLNVLDNDIRVTNIDEELMASNVPSMASSLSGTPPRSPSSSSPASSRSSSVSRSRPYVCDYNGCQKSYTKPSLLEQHKRSHENVRPFKCQEVGCDKAFYRKSHLNVHVLSHKVGSEKPFSCKICGKGVNTRQHLKRHEITHYKSFKCSFENCEVSFYKNNQLKNHILAVHENKLTCKDCGKDFSRPYRLANHREKAHGLAPAYQCTHGNCASVFKTWSALQFHIKTEHPKIKCSLCSRPCVGEAGLRMHMIIHDETKTIRIWNCKECPSAFQKKSNLLEHYQKDHKDSQIPDSLHDSEESFKADEIASMERDKNEKNSIDPTFFNENEDGCVSDSSTRSRSSISDILSRSQLSVFDIISSMGEKTVKTLQCKYTNCHRMFKNDYDLRRHLNWHDNKRQQARAILDASTLESEKIVPLDFNSTFSSNKTTDDDTFARSEAAEALASMSKMCGRKEL